jgi:hypothetical protein
MLIITAFCLTAHIAIAQSVEETMDTIVTRMYAEMDESELAALDDAAIQAFITADERAALATQYVQFDVNVPVIVSVMRETGQAITPFWLEESGFKKTDLVVTNTENWQYEVWQKTFDAGHVGLGINGFDKHRPHYFVAVAPQEAGETVELTNIHPQEFPVAWMAEGAMVYHDWDSLLLKDVPDELQGQQFITTIRGRAREAHLIGAFRKTPYPSSTQPDQVALTWSDDPQTTQTVQWRTNTEVKDGVAQYRMQDEADWQEVQADIEEVQDRQLMNDRYCHRFTAVLRDLAPGATYLYRVGSPEHATWSPATEFRTAPAENEPFTFITFGDTHKNEAWGAMLDQTLERHPETAFYTIAGDLVSTGQYRDDWDEFFHLSSSAFSRRPLLPSIGNHDALDGLGAGLYRSVFALPENGPEYIPKENAYAIEYGNLLFLSLDSTHAEVDQAAWLEEQLAKSDATWKIAVFHFPPYNWDEPYPRIDALWGYLFDKYHLDIALQGHMHYYMRSHPMRRNRPVDSPADGTIHIMSIAIPNEERDLPPAAYAAVQFSGPPLYQTFKIDGNRLEYTSREADGKIRDEFVIQK